MSGPTENQLRQELKDLRERDGPTDGTLAGARVAWRDAVPDGMAWNAGGDDERAVLGFDVWSAQRETLDAVDSGEHDIVAFLAGYGSGKSVFGARWVNTHILRDVRLSILSVSVERDG